MLSIIKSVFGMGDVVKGGMKMLDDAFYTDSEKAEDKQIMSQLKTKNKIDLMKAYAPFKLAQRVLAFMFCGVFVFILLNGVLGALYGIVEMENVKAAKEFANEMWLGEIVVMIVGFYFGGGLAESIKKGKNND